MTKVVLTILLTSPCWGAWAIANQTVINNVSCGGSGNAVTIPSTTSGNALIISFITSTTTDSVTAITNNGTAATWVNANARSTSTGANQGNDIWYALNVASGITTVTHTCSGSPSSWGVIYEVSGLMTSGALDVVNAVSNQSASTTPLGAAVTTTAVGDFIVSSISPAQTITGQQGGNEFTLDSTINGNGFSHITSTSATAASHQAQWTQSPSGAFCSSTAAFKIVGGGGGVTIFRRPPVTF